ncbi:hypothetical protein ACFW0L_22400 [Priestia megaterium]|uniref:hypothetical protein n=1 Tax=Priestia megaterium TaxID=1404 RepID=UPI0015DCA943|nr:hypothetical protein [Priestia megaterium]QLK07503.1 hypothetical protein BMG_4057 [Priestia megaterium]
MKKAERKITLKSRSLLVLFSRHLFYFQSPLPLLLHLTRFIKSEVPQTKRLVQALDKSIWEEAPM